MADNSISFECIIKEIKSRTGADLDKTGRLVIEFIPTNHILNGLNELHIPDEGVKITIEPTNNNRGYSLNG